MKDQYIAVAKPIGDESYYFKTTGTAARLYNLWFLEIVERYALPIRANKPETAVQSSEPFLLAPHGLFIMGYMHYLLYS